MIKETIEAFKSQFDFLSYLIMINPYLSIPFTIYIIIEMFLFYIGDTLLIMRLYQKIVEEFK
jgi:hypothetical protein